MRTRKIRTCRKPVGKIGPIYLIVGIGIGAAVLCVILSLFIGKRESMQENKTKEWEKEQAETFTLPASPLLLFSNPEEENLAGMLQDTAFGMLVRIFTDSASGSGVIYGVEGENLVIVTAAHVLQNGKETVQVQFADNFLAECRHYRISPNADAAFLSIPISKIPKEHLEEYYRVNISKESFDALQSGDRIIVMGSKSGVAGEAYEGRLLESWIYLEDFAQYMMLVKGEAVNGMSGGGVFDEKGQFIGILCGGNEEGELAVLSLGVIDAEYRKLFQKSFRSETLTSMKICWKIEHSGSV